LNKDERFFLPSAFFVRESYFGPKKTKVAWIHIDTNMFYYEPSDYEDPERLNMLSQLKQFGWYSVEAINEKLKWIEDKLAEQQDSKWIFVVGKYATNHFSR
jgi:tartrate-resistant acid phosphatase type 5